VRVRLSSSLAGSAWGKTRQQGKHARGIAHPCNKERSLFSGYVPSSWAGENIPIAKTSEDLEREADDRLRLVHTDSGRCKLLASLAGLPRLRPETAGSFTEGIMCRHGKPTDRE
jgi:hypothetical protein